jgi:hypothetical protein
MAAFSKTRSEFVRSFFAEIGKARAKKSHPRKSRTVNIERFHQCALPRLGHSYCSVPRKGGLPMDAVKIERCGENLQT